MLTRAHEGIEGSLSQHTGWAASVIGLSGSCQANPEDGNRHHHLALALMGWKSFTKCLEIRYNGHHCQNSKTVELNGQIWLQIWLSDKSYNTCVVYNNCQPSWKVLFISLYLFITVYNCKNFLKEQVRWVLILILKISYLQFVQI